MEEEQEDNKQHKIVTSIGDSWVICRSQTHSGRVYYFNTLTGKAVWNLSDSEMKKAHLHTLSIQGNVAASIKNCPEPMEPPSDMPQSAQETRGPRIYNKQIINNRFSKPFTVPHFAKFHPLNYNSLNNLNNASVNVAPPVYNPNMWAVPPPQPVFLTPVVNPFANQPLFNNIGLQSQSVGVDNPFQVINDFDKNGLYHGNCNDILHNYSSARMSQRFSWNFQNKSTHDLRNILHSKRKLSLDKRDIKIQGTCNDSGNYQDVASINEADLYPSDIDDEWLQAYTDNVKNKLNLNVSSVWRLARGDENKDCWFIVVSAMVLLNHMKFLTNLIDSDASARAVAPLEERRRLRSAAAAAALAPRARRAARLAARLGNRVPDGCNACYRGSIFHCCEDLLRQNYYVIHLTDDTDLLKSETELRNLNYVPVFTVNDLKEYLSQNSYGPTDEPRNITVTVSPDDHGNKHTADETTPNQETPRTLAKDDSICTPTETPSPKTKETEAEHDPPKKRTVNVSVQTDIILEPSSLVSVNSSELDCTEMNHSFNRDNELQSDSRKDETNVRKIKLNRGQSVRKEDSVKKILTVKTSYKWRKRRSAPINTSAKVDSPQRSNTSNDKLNESDCSTLLSNVFQQNDNAVDYGQNMAPVKEAPADDREKDASTSDVISNSVESDSMFKLNRKAIISEPSYCEKDIVMFEVTGDQMDDYLSRGCDEWLSRFVQIMEEALSQILQQEPAFEDRSLPAPWTVHEATLCIERKFSHNTNISYACIKLLAVLHKLSDDKGKIYPNLDPPSFMQMYSYGVNLIEALKSELHDSEDLQIAMESLSKLLSDIRNPNLEGSHNVFTDPFNFDSGHVANPTETRKEDGNITGVESKKESPREKPQQVSSNHSSPSKYNIRSVEQKTKTELTSVKSTDKESSFFTGLGLRKKVHIDGPAIRVSFENSQTNVPWSPEVPEIIDGQVQPTVIRNFNRCLEYEERLKQNPQFDSEFAVDNVCSGSKFYLEEDYSDGFSEEQSCRSSEIDASIILKWFVERTTFPIHRTLEQIHKFCTEAKDEILHKNTSDGEYKTGLFEKTTKVSAHLENLCKQLNSIVQRKDTKSKFEEMMRELQIDNFVVDDKQAADYKTIIEKYLEQAVLLLEVLKDIAAVVQTC